MRGARAATDRGKMAPTGQSNAPGRPVEAFSINAKPWSGIAAAAAVTQPGDTVREPGNVNRERPRLDRGQTCDLSHIRDAGEG